MLKRLDRHLVRLILLIAIIGIGLIWVPVPAIAAADLTRSYTAQIAYPTDGDYAANMRLAMMQTQAFFSTTHFKQDINYSLLHMALHNDLTARAGYVATAQGVGAGACGVARLIDSVALNAVYRDMDAIEKPLFQSLGAIPASESLDGLCSVAFGADPGGKHAQDYVWRLNPNYLGPAPRLALNLTDGGAALTVTYTDRQPAPAVPASPRGYAAQVAEQFGAIIKARKLGIAVLPLTGRHGVDETGANIDEQLPVASAFKGPVALYFFENVNPAVWRSVPVRYWDTDKADDVPAEYRTDWLRYGAVLKDAYQMAVLSENDATGRTLAYVFQNSSHPPTSANPVSVFNDWSLRHVGIGAISGLHAWIAGPTSCVGCTDERYGSRPLVYAGKILYINNTYSPRDLARFYVYLATQGRALGYYDAAVELLSHQHFSLIRQETLPFGIQAATKDGYIAPNSAYGDGFRISTDAGLITLPDGEQYAVAFMAFDAGDLLIPSIQTLSRALIAHQRAAF